MTLLAIATALPLLLLAGCGDATPSTGQAAAAPAARGAPTRADVEAVLTRRIKALATGVGSSHSDVDITFTSVQIAPGRTPNEQDRIDGIRGATAWPVRVRYTEDRRWGAGSRETVETYYAYEFYRDDFGEWNYVGQGPVR